MWCDWAESVSRPPLSELGATVVPFETSEVQDSNCYIHAPSVVLPDFANMAVKGDHVSRAQTCLMLVASSGERRRGNRPAFSTWDVAKFCASLSRAAPL